LKEKFIKEKIYKKIFKNYVNELEELTKDCQSLLDVGCGMESPIMHFKKRINAVGVDAFLPSIERSKAQNIHNEYFNIGVLELDKQFENKSFDCVLASDLIEHLHKDDGFKLLELAEKIAKKRVVIFTPNGFLKQGEYDNNPWQVHLSGWEINEMEERGYKVIGINGHKFFRGEYAHIKYKPRFLWTLLSDLSQKFVRDSPKNAFQILCYKDV
jgi:SAM-dependent methyltransferase